MTHIRVIPGAIGREWAQALVLTRLPAGTTHPDVDLVPLGGGEPHPCAVLPVLIPASYPAGGFREALGDLRCFTARAEGLPAGRFRFRARQPGATHDSGVVHLVPRTVEHPLKLLLASCFYQDTGRGGTYRAMLSSLYCQDAHLRLLLGDNLYFDVPARGHWHIPYPGMPGANDDVVSAYTRYWLGHDGYGESLADKPSIATFDDHEFWNDYPEAPHIGLGLSFAARREQFAVAAQAGLDYFQMPLNPGDALVRRSFAWDESPLISLFNLDVRTDRTSIDELEPRMVEDEAMLAMELWAETLDRPGVLVLGQPLWIAGGSQFDRTPPDFDADYGRIWQALARAPFDVLVVSGDVHHSRALRVDVPVKDAQGTPTTVPVHEVVSSPASDVWSPFPSPGGYEIPTEISAPVPGTTRRRRPRLSEFFFGTTTPKTLGTLTFRQKRTGTVAVSVAFIDGNGRRVAPARNERPKHVPSLYPEGAPCLANDLFTLGPRPQHMLPENVT
ncbi:MAG: hypothetical protein GY946_34230 [bacterium]|nr:hypothetical protein [bacterium]